MAKLTLTMKFKRLFTPTEARSTLPLVRQIVSDILTTARRIRTADEGDSEVERLEGELAEQLRELEAIGCFFKDWKFGVGLVDFPAEIDGETVLLCWRSDEEDLAWYHPIEEGYRGRKPLSKENPAG